ncbi:MAG: tetratricopeptide repeat protein, partial [Planctomycetaceae bacterium]|nr:tetratricopeptide repeat protein [Planctomycetaceae bacterium]
MSESASRLLNQASLPGAASASGGWILNSWWDQLLIVSTPLVVVPIVFLLSSSWVGVEVDTIVIIVTAFFALGHHLPGMIRAYGDRELFQRFRLRFIFAPLTFIAVSFPLYRYHYEVFMVTLYFWGCWHGLMQLYGFVRIYDAKVGSNAPVTVWLDWLMCLSWFPTALTFSHRRTADFLEFWYTFGGPAIPASSVPVFRWICLLCSVTILLAFIVNYVVQSWRGQPPNPVKLLMLSSGIGFWWFSFVYLQFSGLSVTLFEIAHDVQYMTITWLFNCRRVKSNPEFDGFMRFVFRRGMVLLYLGLIAAYGALGLVPSIVQDGSVFAFFNAFILISTILHYYYDGFIWKVREKSTQAALGVGAGTNVSRSTSMNGGGIPHLLKWSPMILFIGWLFVTDITDSTVTAEEKKELKQLYEQQLMASTTAPKGEARQSWLFAEFDQVQKIAAAVPGDQDAQLRAAVMLANFGRKDEAVDLVRAFLKQRPDSANAWLVFGEIDLSRGRPDEAFKSFESAFSCATTDRERSTASLKQGEVYAIRKQYQSARQKFEQALQYNPRLKSTLDSRR